MKKFLYKTLLFACFITFCAYGLDMFMSWRLRTNENRIYAAWNQVYNSDLDYDLVVNGSSRAWTQYSPLILDSILSINTFNLGMDGSAVNRQIIKYEKFSSIHNTPTCIVQNIDYATMDIETIKALQAQQKKQQLEKEKQEGKDDNKEDNDSKEEKEEVNTSTSTNEENKENKKKRGRKKKNLNS
mgnify:CR=1 FL=1